MKKPIISKYDLEMLFIVLGFLAIGICLGIAFYQQNNNLEVGNFKMPEQKFEVLTDAILTTQPFTVCEIDGEECLIMVVTTKKVIENAGQK